MSQSNKNIPTSGEYTIDLNYRLMCKYCKKIPPNILEDYKAGDLVCGDCGLVFPGRIIDNRSEWRNFSSETGGANDDPSRVGAAENPLLEGVVDQLSTSIGMRDNRTGQSMILNKTHSKITGSIKGDRDLSQSFKDISLLSEKMGLPKVVSDSAKQIYKKVFDEDIGRGKPNDAIIAACIHSACKQEGAARSFLEISQIAQIERKVLTRCIKLILPVCIGTSHNEKSSVARTEEYIPRFCSHLNLDNSVQSAAVLAVRKINELGLLSGKNPLTIASVAIYMISQLSKTPKTEKEISPISNVSETTIKNAYKHVYAHRSEIIPSDYKKNVDIDTLPMPS